MKTIIFFVILLTSTLSFAKAPGFPSTSGEEAIKKHYKQLDKIAAKHGMSKKDFEKLLKKDKSNRLDNNGELFVHDEGLLPNYLGDSEAIINPRASQIPDADTFKLHSRPGASKTIVLDFKGEIVNNTYWNTNGSINAAPFNFNGRDPNTFDADEMLIIRDVWLKVAEDYAPFDVNITTEDLTTFNGLRVILTSSSGWYCGYDPITGADYHCVGGVAYLNSFDTRNSPGPAWVFSSSLGNNSKFIAEAASHEAGHTLGLYHQGNYADDGHTISCYNWGIGSGDTGWAPIMGVGYDQKNTTWHNGPSYSPLAPQDDIAIISNTLPKIADDAPDMVSGSSFKKVNFVQNLTSVSLKHSGIIASSGDIDVLRIYAGNGPLNILVSGGDDSTNLDFKIQLISSSGKVVAQQDIPGSVNLQINLPNVTQDIYSLIITPVAHATNSIGTEIVYTNYGSLGRYYITGSAANYSASIPSDTFSVSGTGGTKVTGGRKRSSR